MARIIVSYFNAREKYFGELNCSIGGFVQSLVNYGNDVFLLNTAFVEANNDNTLKSKSMSLALLERAKAFDPELIITFNHRIPRDFLDSFDVPIIIWDGDESSYFFDPAYIRDNISRYKVFSVTQEWINDYFGFNFQKDQVFSVPMATTVSKDDVKQTMNVSFLGTMLSHNKKYSHLIKSKRMAADQFNEIIQVFLNTGNYDYEYLFHRHFPFHLKYPGLEMTLRELYPLFDYTWLTLSNTLDLGLTISGVNSNWESTSEFTPQLAAAYNPQLLIWTPEQTSWFYNSSKVSICPIHPQARGVAFPSRVFDIMASNACLLTQESSDLKEMTKNYLDMPMFTTPWEARELCVKMLTDDEYRMSIVNASQKYVDENARWIHRFKDIEHITGMDLFKNKTSEGSLINVILDDHDIQELLSIEMKKALFPNKQFKEPVFRKILKKAKEWSSVQKIIAITRFCTSLLLFGIALMLVSGIPADIRTDIQANMRKFIDTMGMIVLCGGIVGFMAAGCLGVANVISRIRR